MNVLISGATGNVGGHVAAQLIALGHRPRLLVRNPEKARARFGDRVDLVEGDLNQPDTLGPAFAGIDRFFLVSFGIDGPCTDGPNAAIAKAAGVSHIVKLSTLGTVRGDGVGGAINRWHREGEDDLVASGLDWTFVRPGSFMSNSLSWAPTIKSMGKVFSTTGEGRVAPIHPADIAEISVLALTGSGHAGQTYEMTGGQPLTYGEMVAEIGAALGRPLQYVDIPESVARENMARAGMPPALIDGIQSLMGMIRAGKGDRVTDTVARVTGHPPRTFATWVAENIAAFR